eukprot:gnl/MRDRNA2_/MRDRNA2_23692_c0_seq1.p1 gnl/MRDRNA2_/MRDRNA2_23692_c0~~gnl/MRDRNA2_/MRDRNA2_23692_c0_seq1.p1  ORF type:complete len:289 (-),score=53.06 gnl/MRDRNA2_/MRDRNA2_23692_c0_seq1:792-1658(-)
MMMRIVLAIILLLSCTQAHKEDSPCQPTDTRLRAKAIKAKQAFIRTVRTGWGALAALVSTHYFMSRVFLSAWKRSLRGAESRALTEEKREFTKEDSFQRNEGADMSEDRVIQVVYDATCPSCLIAIGILRNISCTLPGPTVALHPWPSADAEAALAKFPKNQQVFGKEVHELILAHLPTGLVFPVNPTCEQEVMQLAEEMEYLAFVKIPDPAVLTLADQQYFQPLREVQVESVSQPWWNQPFAFKSVAQALHDRSFCILDNFLPEPVAQSLYTHVLEAKPKMERGIRD